MENADIVMDNARSPRTPLSASMWSSNNNSNKGEILPPLCFYKAVMRKSHSSSRSSSINRRDSSGCSMSPQRRVKKRSTSFPVDAKKTEELINRWDSMTLLSATAGAPRTAATRLRDVAPPRRARSSDGFFDASAETGELTMAELQDMCNNSGSSKVDVEPRRPRRRNSDSFSQLPESTLDDILAEALGVMSDLEF